MTAVTNPSETLPRVDKDLPIIVSYDYDHRWIVEIPILYDDNTVEYEFVWNHLHLVDVIDPNDVFTGSFNYPGLANKREAVTTGREAAELLGLKIEIHGNKEMLVAQRNATKRRREKEAKEHASLRNIPITVLVSQNDIAKLLSSGKSTKRKSNNQIVQTALNNLLSM
jgi:hypothetical protein